MANQHSSNYLLAADIDGTLLGDETGEALLHEFMAAHLGSFPQSRDLRQVWLVSLRELQSATGEELGALLPPSRPSL